MRLWFAAEKSEVVGTKNEVTDDRLQVTDEVTQIRDGFGRSEVSLVPIHDDLSLFCSLWF